jgi:serpin B
MAYDGKVLSMPVIAPTKGTFATFESSLTGSKVLDILASLEIQELNLSFPKLRVEGAFSLKEPLKELGMQKAFTSADFSGISMTEPLVVKDVVHKTFVEIDENGTVAAAATGVVVANGSASVPPEMKVDRPFITAIIDRPTKTLLFVGRILEPKL